MTVPAEGGGQQPRRTALAGMASVPSAPGLSSLLQRAKEQVRMVYTVGKS